MTPLWTGAGLKTLEGEWLLVWEGHQSPKGKMGGGTEGKYHALDCFSDYNVTLKQNSSGLAQRPGTRLAKKVLSSIDCFPLYKQSCICLKCAKT